MGQSQRREAAALLKARLGLHIPHLHWGAAMWQEQERRVMHLPWASLIVVVHSHQPAMGETPDGC